MRPAIDGVDEHSDRVLPADFYAQEPHALARDLLGRDLLIQHGARDFRRGRIVETEVYGFIPDPASHSYRGIKTRRNQAMFGAAGNAYIYLIYGIYHCFNVVAPADERPSAILVRALHPLEGLEAMAKARGLDARDDDPKKLMSGPGKICQAMQIDRSFDAHPLWRSPLSIRAGAPQAVRDAMEIVSGPRVGLNPKTVGACCAWPWRYGVKGSPFLSRAFKR